MSSLGRIIQCLCLWPHMLLQKNRIKCALTVLGELEELSNSSGESSSSSGSVGMAGGNEGRERVEGKIKGSSAAQGVSQDSSELGSLCSRGDPCSNCSSSSSWSCKIHRHMCVIHEYTHVHQMSKRSQSSNRDRSFSLRK